MFGCALSEKVFFWHKYSRQNLIGNVQYQVIMVPSQLITNAWNLRTFLSSLSLSGVHGAAHKNSVWGRAGEGRKGSVHLDEREKRLIELYSLTWSFYTW